MSRIRHSARTHAIFCCRYFARTRADTCPTFVRDSADGRISVVIAFLAVVCFCFRRTHNCRHVTCDTHTLHHRADGRTTFRRSTEANERKINMRTARSVSRASEFLKCPQAHVPSRR